MHFQKVFDTCLSPLYHSIYLSIYLFIYLSNYLSIYLFRCSDTLSHYWILITTAYNNYCHTAAPPSRRFLYKMFCKNFSIVLQYSYIIIFVGLFSIIESTNLIFAKILCECVCFVNLCVCVDYINGPTCKITNSIDIYTSVFYAINGKVKDSGPLINNYYR